ncbi:MAG: hypothetical protein ACKVZ6_18480 [Kineosporiaceae bacterium]
MEGITNDTGELGCMMGPKSDEYWAEGLLELAVDDDEALGVDAAGVSAGAARTVGGWGGESLPADDFATSTAPTRSSMTVTAAARLPRRSPNVEECDIRRGCEPCER